MFAPKSPSSRSSLRSSLFETVPSFFAARLAFQTNPRKKTASLCTECLTSVASMLSLSPQLRLRMKHKMNAKGRAHKGGIYLPPSHQDLWHLHSERKTGIMVPCLKMRKANIFPQGQFLERTLNVQFRPWHSHTSTSSHTCSTAIVLGWMPHTRSAVASSSLIRGRYSTRGTSWATQSDTTEGSTLQNSFLSHPEEPRSNPRLNFSSTNVPPPPLPKFLPSHP